MAKIADPNRIFLSCCNIYFIVLFLTMITSISIGGIGFGIFSLASNCVPTISISIPMIIIGFILLFISILGFIGSCRKNNILIGTFLVILLCSVIVLIIFSRKASTELHKTGAADPKKFENKFPSDQKWIKTRKCLENSKSCLHLTKKNNMTEQEYNRLKLTPHQIACCRPPKECAFRYVHPTEWSSLNGNFSNPDCEKWSNNPKELCYNCKSCKVDFETTTAAGYSLALYGNSFATFLLSCALIIVGIYKFIKKIRVS